MSLAARLRAIRDAALLRLLAWDTDRLEQNLHAVSAAEAHARLASRLDAAEARGRELEADLREARAHANGYRARLDLSQKNAETYRAQLAAVTAEREEANALLEETTDRLSSALTQLAEERARMADATAHILGLDEAIARLDKEVADERARRVEAERELQFLEHGAIDMAEVRKRVGAYYRDLRNAQRVTEGLAPIASPPPGHDEATAGAATPPTPGRSSRP